MTLRFAFAAILLAAGSVSGSALAGPNAAADNLPAAGPILASSFADTTESDPMLAFSAPGVGAGTGSGFSTGLPQPVSPDTVLDAVTVDLPVWPWSTPVDQSLGDPAQGYNVWTYGLAVLLIAAGLALGRRKDRPGEKPGKASQRLGQPSAAD